MKRSKAIRNLVGVLAGMDPDDAEFDEKVERLIFCEMNFPGTAETIVKLVRSKIFQKYPITPEMIAEAAKLQAIERIEGAGLSEIHTSDFRQMELESDTRAWGTVRVYAQYCRESQTLFTRFVRSGKAFDMKKVITAARSNR